mgnify:CR=1 FL=1
MCNDAEIDKDRNPDTKPVNKRVLRNRRNNPEQPESRVDEQYYRCDECGKRSLVC